MPLSYLLYDQKFAPLDHWRRVLPDVETQDARSFSADPKAGGFLWLNTDVPEWEKVSQRWADAGAKVLVFSRQPAPSEMNRALASGARAYLPALSNARVVSRAKESVSSGGLWFPEELLGSLLQLVSGVLQDAGRPAAKVDLSILTAREQEVAGAAARGNSNRQIADSLGITERTVKEHMGSIFRKLKVKDRMQLMLLVTGQRPSTGSSHVR